MNREEQIIEASRNQLVKSGLTKFDDVSFIAGAQWADKTMLQEVFEWLDKLTIDDADGCGHPIVSFTRYDDKEEMIQSFKERFNIE